MHNACFPHFADSGSLANPEHLICLASPANTENFINVSPFALKLAHCITEAEFKETRRRPSLASRNVRESLCFALDGGGQPKVSLGPFVPQLRKCFMRFMDLESDVEQMICFPAASAIGGGGLSAAPRLEIKTCLPTNLADIRSLQPQRLRYVLCVRRILNRRLNGYGVRSVLEEFNCIVPHPLGEEEAAEHLAVIHQQGSVLDIPSSHLGTKLCLDLTAADEERAALKPGICIPGLNTAAVENFDDELPGFLRLAFCIDPNVRKSSLLNVFTKLQSCFSGLRQRRRVQGRCAATLRDGLLQAAAYGRHSWKASTSAAVAVFATNIGATSFSRARELRGRREGLLQSWDRHH